MNVKPEVDKASSPPGFRESIQSSLQQIKNNQTYSLNDVLGVGLIDDEQNLIYIHRAKTHDGE